MQASKKFEYLKSNNLFGGWGGGITLLLGYQEPGDTVCMWEIPDNVGELAVSGGNPPPPSLFNPLL